MLNTYISTFKEQQMPYCAEWNVAQKKGFAIPEKNQPPH